MYSNLDKYEHTFKV